MIDTHCHLTHARFSGDLPEVLDRARQAGLSACITIGTGADDAVHGLDLAADSGGFVQCCCGIDPFTAHRVGAAFGEELARIEELLSGGRFVGLGEVGLDYHYDLDPKPLQAERFEAQLDLALRLNLPVVIHVREAHDDLARILAAHPRNRGVVHSFTAGPREAEPYLDLGWYLAFNGVATFKNAEEVREAARLTPADRLLVETDAPYLAPVPRRGKRCEPADVAHTARRLANVRGVSVADVARQTTENAQRLFGLGESGERHPSGRSDETPRQG